jgi:hypothetical protein
VINSFDFRKIAVGDRVTAGDLGFNSTSMPAIGEMLAHRESCEYGLGCALTKEGRDPRLGLVATG